MTERFVDRARKSAIHWKATTESLPDAARGPAAYLRSGQPRGRYPFCFPAGYATYNLLPDVRESALREFADKGIAWHAQTALGPTNHLLSSQIQCVNALEPLAHNRDLLLNALGDVLPISEPLVIEPGRFVAFELIGAVDYLGEVPTGERKRGAHTTSADAAIRYRTPDGHIEIALIEWKYTEEYIDHELSTDKRDIRRGRYRQLWNAADSPLRTDLIPYDDMFVEPFYQLMRQQLLAHELEKAHEGDADVVRVVHISPASNIELRKSLNRASHRTAGDDVFEIWRAMLRTPDRFIAIDSGRFCELGYPEYAARYGHC